MVRARIETASAEVAASPMYAPSDLTVASVVDLFCGAGGLSHGLSMEGFSIACGYDLDAACRYPFETNNDAPFRCRDVTTVTGAEIVAEFEPKLPRVLVGCAPCQPFSLYTQGRDDPKWTLLSEFARLVEGAGPDIVSMENVQRLRRFRRGAVLRDFIQRLERAEFHVSCQDVYCPDYGVPQGRTRLVLLASRYAPIALIPPTVKPEHYATVKDAIKELPHLDSGGADQSDPIHAASSLSPLNKKRIKASKPGGTWRDWPISLVAACHRNSSGEGYSSVYGRMRWDEPAPTITTQFHGFGSGRFGHPEQDRALSLREGAILQTFPLDYRFVPSAQKVEFATLGRLIGNAVPVALARAIGKSIRNHLDEMRTLGRLTA